jgi:hypothetical protein
MNTFISREVRNIAIITKTYTISRKLRYFQVGGAINPGKMWYHSKSSHNYVWKCLKFAASASTETVQTVQRKTSSNQSMPACKCITEVLFIITALFQVIFAAITRLKLFRANSHIPLHCNYFALNTFKFLFSISILVHNFWSCCLDLWQNWLHLLLGDTCVNSSNCMKSHSNKVLQAFFPLVWVPKSYTCYYYYCCFILFLWRTYYMSTDYVGLCDISA